ncbi:hypothetical protein [Porticoccus sp.]
MQLFSLLVGMIPFGVIMFLILKNMEKLLQQRVDGAFKKLHDQLSGIKKNEFLYYTNGHPYVWVETSLKDIEEEIRNSKYVRGVVPENFSISIDENRKSVYFVHTPRKKFKFDDLHHYDEWIESQKEVAENIAKYKNS